MRYEVYTINGLRGVARSYKQALHLASNVPANTNGKFAILVKTGKHTYPIQGYQGQNGVAYKSTMLVYPAPLENVKCRTYTAESYLQDAFA